MTLAKGMRPEGPYILHKLEKYQSMRKVLSDGEFRIGNLNFEFGGSATFVLLSTFAAGNYEKNEAKLLKKSIEEGDVVLELGSGIGFMEVIANSNVTCARYVAYEANPELIQVINNNMKRNNVQFEIRNKLLFDGIGIHPFYVTESFWASSLIKPKHDNFVEYSVISDDKHEVMKELKPTMLIIDIEGGEYALFNDLDLSSVNKIVLEVHKRVLSNLELSTMYRNILNAGFVWDFATSSGNVVYFHR
jgi:FkbM family methyltransferase